MEGYYYYGAPGEHQMPNAFPMRFPADDPKKRNVQVPRDRFRSNFEVSQSFFSYVPQQGDYPSMRRRNLRIFSDWQLELLLNPFLLNHTELESGGFPVDYNSVSGCAFVYKKDYSLYHNPANLNPEAREFVPGGCQKLLVPVHENSTKPSDKSILLRKCERCAFSFPVDSKTGDYLSMEKCVYHPGKFIRGARECCGAARDAEGCTIYKCHVWCGTSPGCNGPLPDFVQTKPSNFPPSSCSAYGVYAIDGEMVFTKCGLEIIKISVVNLDGLVVYDQFIKPRNEVLDYATKIHGITAEQVCKATKTLKDVQSDLLKIIHAESIILGHGVETDLRVLGISHQRIIDTSYVFPHQDGLPKRLKLKALAKNLLQVNIQVAEHDSIEDAKAAMDVMLCKLEIDLGLHKSV